MTHGTMRDAMKAARDVDSDDILSALGLERRRGTWSYLLPAVGYFVAGLVVGSGIGMLVAPKSGRQMRRELGDKVRDVGSQLGTAAENAMHDVQHQLIGGDGRNRSDESSPARRSTASGSNANVSKS